MRWGWWALGGLKQRAGAAMEAAAAVQVKARAKNQQVQ